MVQNLVPTKPNRRRGNITTLSLWFKSTSICPHSQTCTSMCKFVSEGKRESTLPKYKANNVWLNVRNWHSTDFTSCRLKNNGYWRIGKFWNVIKPARMNHNCRIIVFCNTINIEAKITELGYGISATTNQGCSKLLDSESIW